MKKRKTNELLTKSYLDKKLNEKIGDAENRLNARMDRIMKYLEFHLEPLQKFIQDFAEFRNQTQTTLDKLSGNYQKFDDEHMILTNQYSEVNQKLDNHEDRIKTLEKLKTN